VNCRFDLDALILKNARNVLLINPNASEATTHMMVRLAQDAALPDTRVHGRTASRGPAMIVNEAELGAAAAEVEQVWRAAADGPAWDGVIVSAFGDPGIERVRRAAQLPVVGICEASMREAARGGRRFGIATVTPELVDSIAACARELGLQARYTGTRLTAGDPRVLAADPRALEDALAVAVRQCIALDGAQAVVIGGGPLGQAAVGLAPRFEVPVIAPISAAMRRLDALLREWAPAAHDTDTLSSR
jgi:Asp/Glu/hydantoin racemase